jgi:hypothetical protein
VPATAITELPRLYVGLALLLVLIVALGLFVWYYRRWMFSEPEQSIEAWSLSDLRGLRESGKITLEEYEKMRAAMIGSAGRKADPAGEVEDSGTSPGSDFEVQKRPPDGR